MNIKLTPPTKKFISPKFLRNSIKVSESYNYVGLDGKLHHKDSVYKDGFISTQEYLNYLDNRDFRKLENEIKVLRNKIIYQQETYSEVDPMDIQLIGCYIHKCEKLRDHLLETCGIYLN